MEEKKLSLKAQNLTLENKENLNITGVEHVESFNDEEVTLLTTKGVLIVKGMKLNISKLNVDEGRLTVKGIINSIIYSDKEIEREKEGFFKKIFK